MSAQVEPVSSTTPPAGAHGAPVLLRRACACGGAAGLDGECAECRARRLQRAAVAGAGAGTAPPIVHTVLRQSGRPLDAPTRARMEARLDHGFADVRVHDDATARASADAVDALAYTVGNHVVFGSRTDDGVLAHELAHVVQQSASVVTPGAPLAIDAPDSPLERQAAAVADAVRGGRATAVETRAPGPVVQRLYGSPAGGCGLCYGTPRAVGTEAHAVIERAMVQQWPFLLAEHPFPVIASPTDENGRIDLANMTAGEHVEIAEIKPGNAQGLADGESDLRWYERQLRALGMTVGRLSLWPPYMSLSFATLAPSGCTQAQQLYVEPSVNGVYTYWCTPDYSELIRECDCNTGRRRRVPVKAPEQQEQEQKERARRRAPSGPQGAPAPAPARSVPEEIRDFVRGVAHGAQDADRAAREFVRQHPEVVDYIVVAAVGVAILIVVATILEDIATAGGGILDDPASFAAAAALVRAALELAQRSPTPMLAP